MVTIWPGSPSMIEMVENGKTGGAEGSSVVRIRPVVMPVNSGGSFTKRMGSEMVRFTGVAGGPTVPVLPSGWTSVTSKSKVAVWLAFCLNGV